MGEPLRRWRMRERRWVSRYPRVVSFSPSVSATPWHRSSPPPWASAYFAARLCLACCSRASLPVRRVATSGRWGPHPAAARQHGAPTRDLPCAGEKKAHRPQRGVGVPCRRSEGKQGRKAHAGAGLGSALLLHQRLSPTLAFHTSQDGGLVYLRGAQHTQRTRAAHLKGGQSPSIPGWPPAA